jgi:hypothetical protein
VVAEHEGPPSEDEDSATTQGDEVPVGTVVNQVDEHPMDQVQMVIPGMMREEDGKPFSAERMQQVAKLMEERRKERMKVLTRNLEVCDLLDIRNP